MKTQERWDFAQKYAAKQMIKIRYFLRFYCSHRLNYPTIHPYKYNFPDYCFCGTDGTDALWAAFLIVNTECAIKKKFQKE